jgi:hypothetical protein
MAEGETTRHAVRSSTLQVSSALSCSLVLDLVATTTPPWRLHPDLRAARSRDRIAAQLGEADQIDQPATTSDERKRIAEVEKENRELKRSNEIVRRASAYFAQAELDRPWK